MHFLLCRENLIVQSAYLVLHDKLLIEFDRRQLFSSIAFPRICGERIATYGDLMYCDSANLIFAQLSRNSNFAQKFLSIVT